jgi:4-carboxymuconolactone decarboxylase
MSERIPQAVGTSDEVAAIIAMTAPPERDPPGTISVLAHRPAMLTSFLPWARVLAREGVVARRDHEILALRASVNCRSGFEWGEHLLFARDAGLTDDEVDQIVAGSTDSRWSPRDAALVRAADDDTWAVLAAHYDAPQLVEIVYIVGQYTMLSMVANGLRVNVPAMFRPLPD